MSTYRSDTPYYRPSLFGGFSFFPPVIKWLLISNVAIWLLTDLFLAPFVIDGVRIGGENGIITYFLALWPVGINFWPWQLFTYMFLHGGFGHLFFNMLALWMFGMELENNWGSRRFLMYYLACGVGGAVANLLVAPMLGQTAPTVGASGAVFGALIAFGLLFPDRPILLYFLVPVRAKFFVAGYIALELLYGVMGTADGVAHFAHLGGAAVGFVYTLVMMGKIPLGSWSRRVNQGGMYGAGQRYQRKHEEVLDAKFYDIRSGKQMHEEAEDQQEIVDAILDKISLSGYQSLTDEEKRILNEASKRMN